jgi:uncharacterized protein (TIGR03084 family)
MLLQAIDFEGESDELFTLIEQSDERDWERKSQFKQRTINDVIAHPHLFSSAADLSLNDAGGFAELMRLVAAAREQGTTHLDLPIRGSAGRKIATCSIDGTTFMSRWQAGTSLPTPKASLGRVPDMSVIASITGRLMETWAHGQAIYDLLGQEGKNTDRIRNVAVLGINTFGWTFTNRAMAVPASRPYVRLRAPSGGVWEWGEP